MRNFTILICIFVFFSPSTVSSQQLSSNDKVVRIGELPEYLVVKCDNAYYTFASSINIEIEFKKSSGDSPLKSLQEMLNSPRYLKIENHTDLLNAMSRLGYEYLNNFLQEPAISNTFGRVSFVFRKKEKFRENLP